MVNDIKYIQNTLWAMWKEFQNTYDVERYTEQASDLCEKYEDNELLLNFCQNSVICWTAVINQFAEQHRKDSTM